MSTHNLTNEKPESVFLLNVFARVRDGLGVGHVPMLHELPDVASRIRQERDDLREFLDEIRMALDMPNARPDQLISYVQRCFHV